MENSASNPQAWTFFADKDLEAAEFLFTRPDLTGEVVFLCQQAVEKYLKAFLTMKNISFRKTHDLAELYSKIKEIKDWNIDDVKLEELSDLYVESRYPSKVNFFADGSIPTQEDTKIFLEFAQSVAKIAKAEIQIADVSNV